MKIKSYDNVVHLSASLSYVTNELKDKYNQIPECIALEHSIFNLICLRGLVVTLYQIPD